MPANAIEDVEQDLLLKDFHRSMELILKNLFSCCMVWDY